MPEQVPRRGLRRRRDGSLDLRRFEILLPYDLAEDLEEQVAQMDEARRREPFEISNGGQGLDDQMSSVSGRTAN